MNKIRLFLSFFALWAALALGPASAEEEDGGSFDCRGAQEALREIQRQQLSLTPEDSSESLLELEDRFDRHKAHFVLLQGMQKLNDEYRNLQGMIRKNAARRPPHSREELLELSGKLIEHPQTVKKVAIADQFLTILSNPGNDPGLDAAIRNLVGPENAAIAPEQIWELFGQHCSKALSPNQCQRLNASRGEGDFARGLAVLLTRAAGALKTDCRQARDCRSERREEFKNNIHSYRDALLANIQPSQWEGENFAMNEHQNVIRAREELGGCTQNCQMPTKNLNMAINAYRGKVRSLEKTRSGRQRAWSALKEFNDIADQIRTDQWRKAKINDRLIDRFVRAEPAERSRLRLTPMERSIAKMRATRGEVFKTLTADSHFQSREQIRQNFAEETHNQVEKFFSDDRLDVRFNRFNTTLNRLMGTERKIDFLVLDNNRITLNENQFFGYLDNLSDKGRDRLEKRIGEQVAHAQKEMDSLSKKISSIKDRPVSKDGDKLKHYIFNRFQKNCSGTGDVDIEPIRCRQLPGSHPPKVVLGLGEHFGDILAVMDNPQDPDHITAFRQICQSSPHYRSACSIVHRNYRSSHPSGTIQEVLNKNKRDTLIYDRRGRPIERIVHDTSRGELLAQGLLYGLSQNMENLFMFLGQSHYEDQLDSYVDWAQQEKTWYHQSEQYRQYAEERWVEDWFNHLNPNFAPPPAS